MKQKEIKSITRGAKAFIKEAIDSLPEDQKMDRYAICEKVALLAEERYTGNAMEYQLNRMDIGTTGKILEKIDFFLDNRV